MKTFTAPSLSQAGMNGKRLVLLCIAGVSWWATGMGEAWRGPEGFPVIERFEQFGLEHGLPSLKTQVVLAESDRVWVGTSAGLAVWEGTAFEVIDTAAGLSHPMVTSLAVDPRSGDLWIGTMGGLNWWSAGRMKSYTQLNSGLPNDVVYGVVVWQESVWAATAAGLGRFDLKSGRWTLYDHTNTVMHEPWVYAVAPGDQSLFVGVWGGGVVEHDPERRSWKAYVDPDKEMELDLLPDDGPVHNVTSWVAWDAGVLWQGTYFGLSRYDGARWKTFVADKTGLRSNFVNSIATEGTKAWIAMDRGLALTDGREWVTYRADPEVAERGLIEVQWADGRKLGRPMATRMPSDYVMGVSRAAGSLWVATAKGVARGWFSPERDSSLAYQSKTERN